MRVLGTVLGGVLGIIIWEMTTGNPYGIAVVFFAVFLLVYHVFLTKPPLRMLAIMVMITSLLVVIYEHNYVVTHDPSAEPVWTVAGKVYREKKKTLYKPYSNINFRECFLLSSVSRLARSFPSFLRL